MRVRVINDSDGFRALATPWKELHARGGAGHITTTWEWMSTWWEVFKQGRQLCVLVVEDGDSIIGIAPFIRRRVSYFGCLPYQRLELLASGEDERDEICSEYLDLLLEPSRRKEALRAVFSHLCSKNMAALWDEIILHRLSPEKGTPDDICSVASDLELNKLVIDRRPCFFVSLPGSWEDYEKSLGSHFWAHMRNALKRLSKTGEVAFRVARSEHELDLAKENLANLHQARWREKGKPGVFSSPRFRLFHDLIMRTARENDWLRLGTLYVGKEAVACLYNFRYNGRVEFYQSGIKTLGNWVSLGLIANFYAIREAISEKAKEYDLLAGDSEYKRRLANAQREIISLRLSKQGMKESIYNLMRKGRKRAGGLARLIKGMHAHE